MTMLISMIALVRVITRDTDIFFPINGLIVKQVEQYEIVENRRQ